MAMTGKHQPGPGDALGPRAPYRLDLGQNAKFGPDPAAFAPDWSELLGVDPREAPSSSEAGSAGAEQHAVRVFDWLEGRLQKSAPTIVLKRDPCVAALRELVDQGAEGEQLVTRFLARFSADPSEFVDLSARTSYRSDAPSSSQADQAMTSSPPRSSPRLPGW
jgi:hypothetical protein